ncbi:MAG: hypothetical protein JW900_07415 [Anaerolineae bacterium]|nr:hypothetical protein [Anaerolineae bacterium]
MSDQAPDVTIEEIRYHLELAKRKVQTFELHDGQAISIASKVVLAIAIAQSSLSELVDRLDAIQPQPIGILNISTLDNQETPPMSDDTTLSPRQQITSVLRALIRHIDSPSYPGRMLAIDQTAHQLADMWAKYVRDELLPILDDGSPL